MHLNSNDVLVRVVDLKKVFRSGESDLVLFENLSFEVRRGEMLALVGASGIAVCSPNAASRKLWAKWVWLPPWPPP